MVRIIKAVLLLFLKDGHVTLERHSDNKDVDVIVEAFARNTGNYLEFITTQILIFNLWLYAISYV